MNTDIKRLEDYFQNCRQELTAGYDIMRHSDRLPWINSFCSKFLPILHHMKKFSDSMDDDFVYEFEDHVELMFCNLVQIVTCVRYLEQIIRIDNIRQTVLQDAYRHFVGRIESSISQLLNAIKILHSIDTDSPYLPPIPETNFVEIIYLLIDRLLCYRHFHHEDTELYNFNPRIQIHNIPLMCESLTRQALEFANVALSEDKVALSALCQSVLRECFTLKSKLGELRISNVSDVRLRANALENAIHNLEEYIIDAQLRLVFHCFVGFSNFSPVRIREAIAQDDANLDELIADFNVNLDRAAQIGIFACQFASDIKTKAIIRSSMASMEYLDIYIIPVLQAGERVYTFSRILEAHFEEEIGNFRKAIHEIIDSYALVSCYYEMLNEIIVKIEKDFNRKPLEEILHMANVVHAHFQLTINSEVFKEDEYLKKCYDNVSRMLNECESILKYTEEVDKSRIVKRFRILRSMVARFRDQLPQEKSLEKNDEFIQEDGKENDSMKDSDTDDAEEDEESPSVSAKKSTVEKEDITVPQVANKCKKNFTDKTVEKNEETVSQVAKKAKCEEQEEPSEIIPNIPRRRHSLRTMMFKRNNRLDEALYDSESTTGTNNSLHITEIIAQLTNHWSRSQTASSPMPEWMQF